MKMRNLIVVATMSALLSLSAKAQVATGASGVIGTTIVPTTQQVPLGPTLDVVPYVSADGYTIQMTDPNPYGVFGI